MDIQYGDILRLQYKNSRITHHFPKLGKQGVAKGTNYAISRAHLSGPKQSLFRFPVHPYPAPSTAFRLIRADQGPAKVPRHRTTNLSIEGG